MVCSLRISSSRLFLRAFFRYAGYNDFVLDWFKSGESSSTSGAAFQGTAGSKCCTHRIVKRRGEDLAKAWKGLTGLGFLDTHDPAPG